MNCYLSYGYFVAAYDCRLEKLESSLKKNVRVSPQSKCTFLLSVEKVDIKKILILVICYEFHHESLFLIF